MKIYVSGPMRGIPDFNFPAFDAKAAELRGMGHYVFSPADNDRRRFGDDAFKPGLNPTGNDPTHAARLGMTDLQMRRLLLGDDMAFICQHAERVIMLPGWENSKGAMAERALAIALGIEVEYHD